MGSLLIDIDSVVCVSVDGHTVEVKNDIVLCIEDKMLDRVVVDPASGFSVVSLVTSVAKFDWVVVCSFPFEAAVGISSFV